MEMPQLLNKEKMKTIYNIILLFILCVFFIRCENIKRNDLTIDNNADRNCFFTNIDSAIYYPDEVRALMIFDSIGLEKFYLNYYLFNNLESFTTKGNKSVNFRKLFECLSKNEKIKDLTLWNFGRSAITNNIIEIENLKYVYIENDEAYDLPDSLVYCNNIEELHLYNYNELPLNMHNLSTLKRIFLGKEIQVFPDELIKTINLEGIFIMGNLVEVPKRIVQMENLKWLNISRNPIAREERNHFLNHNKYNKVQFIIDEMPQCELILESHPPY